MVDVIIKDVPSGAEEKVTAMAMVAIERFKRQSLVVPVAAVEAFEKEVDDIRIANTLDAKYSKEVVAEEVVEEPVVEK